jgi:hypothetical protein
MAREKARPQPTEEHVLDAFNKACSSCSRPMWFAYENRRSVSLLAGRVARLRLRVRRCQNAACPRFHVAYRPEEEGRWALPEHEFGLEVIAAIGAWRYQEHRSVPEIHQTLRKQQVETPHLRFGAGVSERTVTHLLNRYDELLAVSLTDQQRLRRIVSGAGRAILAIDGLQPHVGHEVLWVIRECLTGEILLARALLSSTMADLARLLEEVQAALPVPVAGVLTDGQPSLRKGVAQVWPGVPHQLCHFHYLHQAAHPVYEADRHAKKELKKRVRGVRPIERSVEVHPGAEGQVVLDYCAAVRSALTDDGRPPLVASGLTLYRRLTDIRNSLARAGKKGRCRLA